MAYGGEVQTNNTAVATLNGMAGAFQNRMETVPLSRLIDHSIQRTYHELVVLTELLPRKSDMDRKIEIVIFANRTRQLFVRLLALVKWAGSASKVEKCQTIVNFLDKQSMLFIETADILAKMSRENLVQARLPSFQLPSAVEVLTSGTYTRLPACIRDRIVPPDPITAEERKQTLLRLNQIIQQRLVGSQLPSQMRNIRIEFGRVVFHVPFEFELTLTLMSDSPTIPWRVLDLAILVQDKDIGQGKDLVHHLQNSFLQHLVQAKLTENHRSLQEAYEILHSFCLSLQLEVLHAQTVRLSRERLEGYIKVEEYLPGVRLAIAYWQDLLHDNPEHGKGCRLTIQLDSKNPDEPLMAAHQPELGEKETQYANEAIRSKTFSIEKLLIYTTNERAKEILTELARKLKQNKRGAEIDCQLSESPVSLSVSYLRPCLESERLTFSVDSLTGQLLINVPQFDYCPHLDDLQIELKKDLHKFFDILQSLAQWTLRERFKKTAEFLGIRYTETLPLVNVSKRPEFANNGYRLFVQFSRFAHNYLLITFVNHAQHQPKQTYHILSVNTCAEADLAASDIDCPTKAFLTINSIYELNVSCIVRSQLDTMLTIPLTMSTSLKPTMGGFRKRRLEIEYPVVNKKARSASFFIPQFAQVYHFCEEKLIYGALSAELHKRRVCHVLRISSMDQTPGSLHYIEIIQFPDYTVLSRELLNCTIRLQGKAKTWLISYQFCTDRLSEQLFSNKKNNVKSFVCTMYDYSQGSPAQLIRLVDEILSEWQTFSHLYNLLYKFSSTKDLSNHLANNQLRQFNYKKLILCYGPNKVYSISIYWKQSDGMYQLSFGSSGTSSNPHVLVATQLQYEFNQHRCLHQLLNVLNNTHHSLATIQMLSTITHVPMSNKPPVQNFCIVPQSSTHIRVFYRGTYCIDVFIQMDGYVSIRDAACSIFDYTKQFEEIAPIQSLKAFLNRFVDKSQQRRLNEYDNPPSPILQAMDSTTMDTQYTCSLYKGSNINSPADHSAGQMRAAMHINSNPNTPASPHTSLLQQGSYLPSPGHPEPSPSNIFPVNSPISSLHAPSPSHPQPSPAPPGSNSSNYNISMPSPASAGGWPNSPSLNRPSPSRPVQSPAQHVGGGQAVQQQRLLPTRFFPAAVPTVLSQVAFDIMCRPNAPIEENLTTNILYNGLSQLERFLVCMYIRKNMQKVLQNIQAEEMFKILHSPEPNVIQCKNDSFHLRIGLNTSTMQSLHLKITPESKGQWLPEELEILELTFRIRIACAPFKPSTFSTFLRLFTLPTKLLKNCIQLIRLEMKPDPQLPLKWAINWCFNTPPDCQFGSPGMSTIIYKPPNFLLFLQFTQLQRVSGVEPFSFVAPIVYDCNLNKLIVRDTSLPPIIQQILNRATEMHNSIHPNECPILHAVKELMSQDFSFPH